MPRQQTHQLGGTRGGEGGAGDANSLQGASLAALNQRSRDAQNSASRPSRPIAAKPCRTDGRGQRKHRTAARPSALQLESEYQQKLGIFKPDYPDMVKLRARIDALDEQIARGAGTVAAAGPTRLLPQYQAAAASERALQGRVNKLKGAVLDLRGAGIQYNILQREVDTNRRSMTASSSATRRSASPAASAPTTSRSSTTPTLRGAVQAPPDDQPPHRSRPGPDRRTRRGACARVPQRYDQNAGGRAREAAPPVARGDPKKKGADALADELKDQSSPIPEAYFSLRTSLQFTTDTGRPRPC